MRFSIEMSTSDVLTEAFTELGLLNQTAFQYDVMIRIEFINLMSYNFFTAEYILNNNNNSADFPST